ncbi:MAG: exodeoxyribonuclease VII large subunit, partial [Bacteroidaceae bacterium]|nr:exodeoxyribonuclease VII large subunit [Bacteroidaceae bacterium]
MKEQLEKSITLLQLTTMVSKVVKGNFAVPYWVQAELSDVRTIPSGHCYLELLEKDAQNNVPIARCRATIWARTWLGLQTRFEQETGQPFVAGLKVLVCVSIEFHPTYGFSLNILDVDPSYTMGDLQKRRREILSRLAEEGVLNDNKSLKMPLFLQRIAVISSSSAAGYGDFSRQLAENPYGFHFAPELFTAIMQGEQTEQSILSALDKILIRIDEFDLVVIIR